MILGAAIVALFGTVFAGSLWSDASFTPKLALDLEGGTQIILSPITETGETVTPEQITQAIDIIRQRVDASGVSEAEITSQGGTNIVVALPGTPDEETLDLVRQSAQMVFRPVLAVSNPIPIEGAADLGLGEETDGPEPTNASDFAWMTQAVLQDFYALDCTDPVNLTGGSHLLGERDAAVATCSQAGDAKFILGPVELDGTQVASAASGLQVTQTGAVTNQWVTTIDFDSEGTVAFREVTTRLLTLESPRNQFAMVLDGLVVSAPQVNSIIGDGNAEISGNFSRESAGTLARQLNFGSLPLTFEVQSEQQISATLGSESLQKGLLAGLVGLLLVGLYSLVQYRALGTVTIASLVIAGLLTYLTLCVLSWLQGYRLSLPGVAGVIVAIGITADSFIVYFERIKDELRDGRTLVAAVDEGWRRARRTILASDAVNFLAAFVLYFLAVGGVRGFAFTLGLITIVDLIVVFFFTHPVMNRLARTRFFGEGHRFSGLDPVQLGARRRYVGRGRVVEAGEPADRRRADEGLTIAERKAASRRGEDSVVTGVGTPTERKDG